MGRVGLDVQRGPKRLLSYCSAAASSSRGMRKTCLGQALTIAEALGTPGKCFTPGAGSATPSSCERRSV